MLNRQGVAMPSKELNPGLWSPGCKNLEKISSADHARRFIDTYQPADSAQQQEKQRVLNFIDEHPDCLNRSCLTGHLTASALVVDENGNRFLLHHHRKLRRWLQFGGHCDGDGNLVHVAWREAVEESGIESLAIAPEIVDVDIHRIPNHETVPEHLHLDVRFLIYAPTGEVPRISEESDEIRWFTPEDLASIHADESVERLVGKARIGMYRKG